MKNKGNNQNECSLEEKIINLQLENKLQKSSLYLEHLYTKIKFYQKQKDILTENKPLKFQKLKLKRYYQKTKEYDDIIKETYKKIEEEFKIIYELNKQIKN